MKVAIASDDGKKVASHFGRAKGFVVCEIEEKEVKQRDYIPNTFTGHARGLHQGDHGHSHGAAHGRSHAGILEALKDVKVVISHGMGRNLYEDLTQAGKDVYVTDKVNIDEVLVLFVEGKLSHIESLLH
ncbi:NifB/NifX family molybdenum-iron cluster-binding protein [Thermospira aquatica]|uniref:Dinitrogenase iron-molybdenum cofactor biosynthesis domain-containing protein n=1 Tax=Thermospira aquatica TaxID=2828656 RepID=A0AAX3BCT3_9SPIR|nr:NifB/NifX family molybdenum-iron cluster-binding protein [Thermospira aquatica]URA09975.1 hypothetical protein KDW03_10915 [Thermospira aquatica]